MSLSIWLLSFLHYNLELLSFLGGLLTEEIVFILLIINERGAWGIVNVALFGFLGIIVHDVLVYFISKSDFAVKLKKRFAPHKKSRRLIKKIINLGGDDYFMALFLSKFIYGTRIGAVLYASHVEKRFKEFFIKNTLAVVLWLAVVIPLSVILGEGLLRFFHAIKGLERFVIIILAVFIIVYFVRNALIRKKI